MKTLFRFCCLFINKLTRKIICYKPRPITLDEFLLKVKELAIADGKTYYQANVILTEHQHSDKTVYRKIEFTCYIDGYSHYSDVTMEASLEKLRNAMSPTKVSIQEVILPS